MEFPLSTPPPPQLPERPEGVERAPRWPALFALWAFLVGITGTLLLVGVGAAIIGADGESDTPEFVVLSTLIQAVVLVGAAVLFASFVAKPKAWHFGLRRTPLRVGLGWAAAGIVTFVRISFWARVCSRSSCDRGTL